MTMMIEGEYNTASVKADEHEGSEGAVEQIEEMVNHGAFEGDEDIAIMPDYHWGHGAVIGFTKPLGERLVPGTVGVDIGCGMLAVNYGDADLGDLGELDERIRDRVPMGFSVHDDAQYHMHDEFPWELCREKLAEFNENSEWNVSAEYGPEYYDDLLERVDYDPSRAACSVGTLGGGNHFIELGHAAESGDTWCVIHSGSRGLGNTIAQHWMERATETRDLDQAVNWLDEMRDAGYEDYVKFDVDHTPTRVVLDWIHGSMGEDFVDYEALKRDYRESNPERIDEIRGELKRIVHQLQDRERNTDLDYLEGREAHGYVRDMVFAQTYAQVSRREMAHQVTAALTDNVGECAEWVDHVESVHNYIDFDDCTIRKGACRAHDGERVVIPFNIKYGTLICEGKGSEDWNHSAPHGAGRAMGRRDAERKFTEDDFDEQTRGVYTSKEPIDELPAAYKDPSIIENSIGPTVSVVDRVIPELNLKAER